MARLAAVIATSHSPFLFKPLSWWQEVQTGRLFAPGSPVDSDAVNAQKIARIGTAFARLRQVFERARPDVIVVFGDDQEEQFTLKNFPAFAVFVGDRMAGYRSVGYEGPPNLPRLKPRTPEHWTEVKTHPALAKAIMTGVMKAGFDPAFMAALPDEEAGIGHAFTRPVNALDPQFSVPVVPVLVNCFYAPQPTAQRCVAMARAVRSAIEQWPEDLNVVVLGSGGLWHTPGAADAYLDEAFDQQILQHLQAGDADGAARYFDTWAPAEAHKQLRCFDSFASASGMPGGIGSGSGETRNWLMAAAVADRPMQLVDYIPIYASPIGAGFGYWDMGTPTSP